MHRICQRTITQAQAIREALDHQLTQDESVILIGEGVPDPKGIFGTTLGLQEKHGRKRVFDMPLSENGMTGICIGASLSGLKPVLVHQRLDFALLSMDQLINNAAKWHYMFGGQSSVPIVVRVIVGRGWGQGPQHSQSLQALFSHIPGLKVVMPVFPEDSRAMLVTAIQDKNPVIFIEHRWLHGLAGPVKEQIETTRLNKARVVREGNHITLVATSYMVIEGLKAADALSAHGVDVEVLDLRCTSDIDQEAIIASVNKTGLLIVADTGHLSLGISAEIIALATQHCFYKLSKAPERVACPSYPASTSAAQLEDYYPTARHVAGAVFKLKSDISEATQREILRCLSPSGPIDVPSVDYAGPF